MKFLSPRIALSVLFFVATIVTESCSKTDKIIDPPTPPPPSNSGGMVRPIGTSIGAVIKKQIGPEGGTIKSADNSISITIPAGALAATTEIGIEPITNTNIAGLGHAWRLTPHGQHFTKPVSISVNYSAVKDSVSIQESLGLSYQDEKGVWQFISYKTLDKTNKIVVANTDHFSDWILMQTIVLRPQYHVLGEGESVTLDVIEYTDLEDDGGLVVPMPASSSQPVGYYVVESKYIKNWNLGGVGTLTKNGSTAVYKAPASVTTTQTVAVSVELKVSPSQTNQLHIVSNIKLVPKGPHIEYLQVDEENGFLYIYGKGFGNFGEAKPEVKIGSLVLDATDVVQFADIFIQCKIPHVGPNSSGEVRVTSKGKISEPRILNEWNGEFRYFRPQGRVGQSIFEKITFYVRIRGDVDPVPSNIIPFVTHNTINKLSHAKYQAGGSGSSASNCVSYDVSWGETNGDIPLSSMFSGGSRYFKAELERKSTGFELQLIFELENGIPSRLKETYCNGVPPLIQEFNDWLTFVDFDYEKLNLNFSGKTLKAGNVTKTLTATSGLLWPAAEYPLYQHEVKLEWSDFAARY